jgi:RNA polymerase sigma-70 factor (ECF subfamily)
VAGWLQLVIRRLILDRLRSLHCRPAVVPLPRGDVLESNSEDDAAGILLRREAASGLGSAIDALPRSQRQALRLVCIDGLSIAEAARSLRKSRNAVSVSVLRGRKRLRERGPQFGCSTGGCRGSAPLA